MSSCRSIVLGLYLGLVTVAGCTSASDSKQSAVTTAQRVQAASATANSNSFCTAISPFYWEIGNSTEVIGSGSTGDGSIQDTTVLAIASATKWLFGAYVVESTGGVLSANTIKALTMSSGYTSFGNLSCIPSNVTTVLECYNRGSNSTYTPADEGKFFYNGGHFQHWAVESGMGSLSETQLANDFRQKLGAEIDLTFGSPQLAGGVSMSAKEYGEFLRRILRRDLLIGSYLGAHAICTSPSKCASAMMSPMNEDFHYSLGHWVEDDPFTGDGAYSSAGLFGFYPWIDQTTTYYGIISRYEVPAGGNEIGSGYASYLCGRLIRNAFMTGSAE